MSEKYFIVDPKVNPLSKEDVSNVQQEKELVFNKKSSLRQKKTFERLVKEEINLKHTKGRIVIKIDVDYKDSHTFRDGTKIYRGRRFNNLNVRETDPVNAWVVDAEFIPKGAEILIHPNAIHDSNRIFNYDNISIEEDNSLRYYSIEVTSAFLFREGHDKWQPLKGFVIASRVFEPYKGMVEGILPKQIKNVLYLQTGEFANKVAHTVKAADYEIIFMGENGVEQRIIRCRHFEDTVHDREEITSIDGYLTKKVQNGELLIGLSETNCEKLK